MAIYHAHTKPIARSAGRSSVAAAAYRSGCELVDERTGLIHDYTRKGGVVSTAIITPDGVAVERNALWNAAEAAEKRKDARTAREWIVALPAELNADERAALAHSFGVELSRRYGVAVDVAIHLPDREGDNRNHHAHLLTTTRQVSRDQAGGVVMGDKSSIELSDKARRERGLGCAADEVTEIRRLWERTANRALEQAGLDERIDARSLKAQGIDREATTHLGPIATEMERRGVWSDRGRGNQQAQINNRERTQLGAQVIQLRARIDRGDEKLSQAALEPPRGFGAAVATAGAASGSQGAVQPPQAGLRQEGGEKAPPLQKPGESLEQAAERVQREYIGAAMGAEVEAKARSYDAQASEALGRLKALEQQKPMLFGRKDWEWQKTLVGHEVENAEDAARKTRQYCNIGLEAQNRAIRQGSEQFRNEQPALAAVLDQKAERERKAQRDRLEKEMAAKRQRALERGRGGPRR